MDKRQVIHAYRSGIISIQECAQILGLDSRQLPNLLSQMAVKADWETNKRFVNS
ncbi:hypothetical protein [Paenibacillus sp. JDR-2]|uniref:hypothetical protein n=1 Tax=Paenibacillus sp. (strain JDR-2) TaxID=324057 RepID=UPI00016685E3|nr:hypothetical protein [Paenibacillus sp. JDR-2]ACT01069.1 hypothetical protein Pjdr2_2414 [Paenibacillus sp. JDR-2]